MPPARRPRRPAPAAVATATALLAGVLAAAPPASADEPRISDIQGTTRTSPYVGETVDGVPGVVTAMNRFGSARGFWFQDPEGDGDPRTSEGMFVFTGSTTPDVREGDEVRVSGTVQEFLPGDGHQTITQLTGARWEVASRDNPLPEAVLLDPDTVPEAYAPDGDLAEAELRPDDYALDFWAAHEHMRLRVDDARVVGPTDAFNGLWVTTKPEQNPSPRGGTVYGSYDDPNAGRVKVESLIPFAEVPFPLVNVGDELRGATEGPLYYSQFGGYVIRATALGEPVDNGLERVPQRPHEDWELSVATYNVENLSPRDDQEKFDQLAEGVVDHLSSPDILSLEEIQDNSGPTNDGVVDADQTLDQLVAAIKDAGGPTYHWREIPPEDGQDGGQPGGNIRNAYLFNPERVEFVDIPGGDATTPVEVAPGEGGTVQLSASPARVSPGDPAWTASRKPLVGQFRFEGRDVFVVTNHFNSKRGDDPLYGVRQPQERGSEEQRNRQAELVREFVDEVQAVDADANIMVVGDLNDFPFSPTLDILTADGALHNPMLDLPAGERYNYVFDGNSQALDHILVSGALRERADLAVTHVNAEFHDQISDHDPLLLRVRPRSGSPRVDRVEDMDYYGQGPHGWDNRPSRPSSPGQP